MAPARGATNGTVSMIFLPGNFGIGDLVNTIAHEWAHQYGSEEVEAEAVGNATEAAYKADNGAQCGGL